MGIRISFKELHAKYERWMPLAFFAAGFVVDALMLGRIDETFGLVQQAVYLAICGVLLCLSDTGYQPRAPIAEKLWRYREDALHFLLGGLLNTYTILYFKAASLFTSFVFVLILCGLLYVNESKKLRGAKGEVRIVLFTLCLISYLICLIPIVLGGIGTGAFLLSIALVPVAAYPLYRALRGHAAQKQVLRPFVGTLLIFSGLYFSGFIPPVPLSIKAMGIYHDLKKENGQYHLTYTRSRWRFWQNGDQSFAARPGDKLYFFVRVFSPGNFSERLNVRWLRKEKNGWTAWDTIPLPITGGRDEGYRGYVVKSNYAPGDWRVQVETHDQRELGRMYFTVTADSSQDARNAYVDIQ